MASRSYSRAWLPIVNDDTVRKVIRPNCFGALEWSKYFGNVGDEPPLPIGIHRLLSSPCPFFKSYGKTKTIGETHMLVLIPKAITKVVKGKSITLPLSFKNFARISRRVFSCNPLVNFDDGKKPEENPGDEITPQSYWVLMTRDITPNTRAMSIDEVFIELERPIYNSYFLCRYLELAVCILAQQQSSGCYFSYHKENVVEPDHTILTWCGEVTTLKNNPSSTYQIIAGWLYRRKDFEVLRPTQIDTTTVGVVILRRFKLSASSNRERIHFT